MNIIELVKQTLIGYPGITKFANEVHVDYTEDEPGNFGISSTGDELVKEDIIGHQVRKHSFVMYAINQAFTDFDRLTNSNFLLDLSYWLEKAARGQRVGAGAHTRRLDKLSCANAMLYKLPDNGTDGLVTYQLQIYAQYTIESEDFKNG